ncbi:universal stress protein [Pseudemcibacter aquimaris]|uniref:universal stress protein n=1 Tax=Pseudemcibacter aquimaris TaxID=2857064 RepID=UPI002011D8B8|nr:universal stress protein [Pseudemcibacter aquimaris]MCC3862358.1 universal stress protein [Pseudemcibacter aquimaris]WDU59211.1 universal stress protein [Pseudemcibacter aquimaris]
MSEGDNKWKFLIIADDTPEFVKVLRLASKRAEKVGGSILMLKIIPPGDFQHWMSVRDIMEEEAREEAKETLAYYAGEIKRISGLEAETAIREGKPEEVISNIIAEDRDIHLLVLGANVDGDPGPLIRSFREVLLNELHMPVLVVPGNMTDEEIDKFA